MIEPYLLQQGLIQRTPRGRMLAAKAWSHLGLAPPRAGGPVPEPVRGGVTRGPLRTVRSLNMLLILKDKVAGVNQILQRFSSGRIACPGGPGG